MPRASSEGEGRLNPPETLLYIGTATRRSFAPLRVAGVAKWQTR
ncbi:MAG: hypothetical protein RL153_1831 [Verrucomicrobiota bacterium]